MNRSAFIREYVAANASSRQKEDESGKEKDTDIFIHSK